MSGGGGSGSVQNITQSSTPFNAGPLSAGFSQAFQNLATPPQFFPNSTVVPLSPQTTQALDLTQKRALNGSPVTTNANNNIQDTLAGTYLNNIQMPGQSPFLQGAIDAASQGVTRNYMNAVQPGITSQFAGAGRYNNEGGGLLGQTQGVARQDLADTLGGISSSLSNADYNNRLGIYNSNINQERNRQLQAAQMAPTLANQSYTDLSQLANVGQTYEQQAGNQLQDAMSRWNFGQQQPQNSLATFMSMIAGGSMPGQTTSQQPLYSNSLAQNLGLGLGGVGALGSLFGKSGAFPGALSFLGLGG